jgi:hypothetical protein
MRGNPLMIRAAGVLELVRLLPVVALEGFSDGSLASVIEARMDVALYILKHIIIKKSNFITLKLQKFIILQVNSNTPFLQPAVGFFGD